MTKESVLKIMALAKNGDADALSQLKEWRKAQKETSRRVEELKLRLLQLTDKHWEQSISILKGWLVKDEQSKN